MVQLLRRRHRRPPEAEGEAAPAPAETAAAPAIPIADDDPLAAYLVDIAAPVDIARVDLDSPALAELRAAGIELVVPLVGQGELMGALYLGKRLSDQPYS